MRRPTLRTRAFAFTLIELLVVISIIALLISILLPSLKNAKEQAKKVKCQANMRSVNQALITYFYEQSIFPVAYSYLNNNNACPCGWCSWSFGGWLGKNTQWAMGGAWGGGCFRLPAYTRPLSQYMFKNSLHPPETGTNAQTWQEQSGLPVFQCPSDTRTAQILFITGNNPSGNAQAQTFSAYDDVGTSYQQNFYWWGQTSIGGAADADGDGMIKPRFPICCCETPAGCFNHNWRCRFNQGRLIWQRKAEKDASRFETLGEDPFDYAIVNGYIWPGFHGKVGWFNLGFMDTHVEYMKPNTASPKHYGATWTVIDQAYEAPWNFSGVTCNGPACN